MPVILLVLVLWLVGGSQLAGQQQSPFSKIPWERGPVLGDLGKEAQVKVPDGCLFTTAEGTRQFLELNENPTSGRERGVVLCTVGDSVGGGQWFVVFEYDASGYVKDDEKKTLDAAAMLASIRKGTEAANAERRKRGWSTMEITGWEREPYYDEATHNLTWAIRGASEGRTTLNHSVRLLGRKGVMSADLVVVPDHYAASLEAFNAVIGDYGYREGERYSEWRKGDKIAKYGLTALVGGAAGVVLVKTGLLQKFGKLIVVALIAIAAAVKRLFFGKAKEAGEAGEAEARS